MVLPSPCIICGGQLPFIGRRASCCLSCWSDLPELVHARCARCSLPWRGADRDQSYVCVECSRSSRDPIAWVDAWGEYRDGLERLLHAFKFEGHHFLAGPLSTLLLRTFFQRGEFGFDSVVPVPMHPRKVRARGYNQSALLASAFSRKSEIPLDSRFVDRIEERETQSTLPRDRRRANVAGVFAVNRPCDSRRILLIDDICTTGETLRACAKVLRTAGASHVAALVVARA